MLETAQKAAGKAKANRPRTSAVADVNVAAPRSAGAAAEPKKAGDGESPSPASAPAEKEQSTPAEQLAPGLKRGFGGTTYKLVESGAFEISDHTTDRVRQTPTPRTLVVTVILPADAESTRKLDVVVALRKLTIGVLGDPEGSSPRYLDLPLPYDVEDDSKCSAVRDKSGLLKITMPVKQPAAPPLTVPPPLPAAATARVCSDGGRGGAAAATDIDGVSEEHKETLPDEELKHDITTNKAEQTSASPDTTQQCNPDHSRWVDEAPQSEVLQKPWEALPAPPEKQGEARSLLPTPPPPPLPPGAAETPGVVSQQQHEEEENEEEGQQEQQQEQQQQEEEGKEGEEQLQQQQQEEKKEEQEQQQQEEAEEQQEQRRRRRQQQKEGEDNDLEEQLAEDKDKLFIQSERFIRKVDGYEFKTGAKGCGYYRDDSRKKVPRISWNENIKTVCGVVDVPNIVDASVYYGFAENRMVLSFDAETRGQSDGGGARVDRYRTELVLAGGVAANKCSHDTAEDNLVLKLVKSPEREWGLNPAPTKATEVASKIDDLIEIAAAAAAGPREAGAVARGGVQEEGPPAPGYEGSPPAQAEVLRNSLAYEIE
ncbi:unnamed protein product [Ectocarpus sp. CCAP 1310/34]|nr:unnamed protein product [Ectocarpus sp. CCAP 1310/34]